MLGVPLAGGVAAVLQGEDGVVAVVLLGAAVRQGGGVIRGGMAGGGIRAGGGAAHQTGGQNTGQQNRK